MVEGKSIRIAGVVVSLAIASLVFVGPSHADDVDRATNDAGMGLATVVANLFYVPVKVGYAALGGVTGGLGYLLTGGNQQAAERVWVSSFGGDYVLTRQMLQGHERIQFSGASDPDM